MHATKTFEEGCFRFFSPMRREQVLSGVLAKHEVSTSARHFASNSEIVRDSPTSWQELEAGVVHVLDKP